jgi:hypothetical protein
MIYVKPKRDAKIQGKNSSLYFTSPSSGIFWDYTVDTDLARGGAIFLQNIAIT